ncbi:hypothetical protein TNCV_4074011 [Trichonephila clavipes]|uniref:Uncharacterized protein n=1 Tax=Trichonephila clavipes TaxID=2585209 RepID=A0A8X6W883_TRICX|nr:hypothetical protein TNCV_4074011 [Trichonephila clavipes]
MALHIRIRCPYAPKLKLRLSFNCVRYQSADSHEDRLRPHSRQLYRYYEVKDNVLKASVSITVQQSMTKGIMYW